MKKVGIAGAGGIGGNVAVHLVRSGVKEIKIVDFDVVDSSNLNRQFFFRDQIGKPKVEMIRENLLRIRPDLELEIENIKLNTDNIQKTFVDCSIVVEGFDKADAKAMLLEAFAGTEKTVVSACGLAGLDIEAIRTEKRFGNTWIVGDFKTDIRDKKLYSPKVFIVASIMANIVLKEMGFEDKIE